MTELKEPRAMAEIREIRNKLSEKLLSLDPQEQIDYIKQGAE